MHGHALDRNSPRKAKFKSFSTERAVVPAPRPVGASAMFAGLAVLMILVSPPRLFSVLTR
jgi:hypothetical protein